MRWEEHGRRGDPLRYQKRLYFSRLFQSRLYGLRSASALGEKYRKDITIYIGVEEEAGCPVPRERFDYIIGSMHYFLANGRFYSIDGGIDCFKECIDLFGGDPCKMAQCYYETLCSYWSL